jgi:hypothetical protein
VVALRAVTIAVRFVTMTVRPLSVVPVVSVSAFVL